MIYDVVMRRLLSITLLLFITLAHADAQATPGQHEAESSPDFTYEGTGWSQVVDGDYVVMESNEAGDVILFQFDGASISIFRTLFVSDGAMVGVCIDGDGSCTTITNHASGIEMPRIPVSYWVSDDAPSPHMLTLTNLDGGRFQIDSIMVFSAPSLPELQEIPAVLSPTVEYFTLDGRVVGLDFIITGGDIAVVIFLAFLSSALVCFVLVIRWGKHV